MTEAKHIWVLGEHREGVLQDVTLELVSDARKLADKLNEEVHVLLLGRTDLHKLTDPLGLYGVDRVYLVQHQLLEPYTTDAYVQVCADLCRRYHPSIFLIPATVNGQDLAPRLAARLRTGLASHALNFTINREGLLETTREVYSGKVYSTVVCPFSKPQMATMRPGVADKIKLENPRNPTIISVIPELHPERIRTRVLELIPADPKTIDLSESERIIAGGRGVGGKEGFELLQELADVLGASLGASRVAVDQGWVPYEHQIGQTGKTVKPKLYMAVGISGASHHIMGMKDSECIIAINTDRNAEIFKIAHLSVVADIREVIPILTEKLKCLKLKGSKES